MRSEDSKNFIIKNCPCYKKYDNSNMNCIAEPLGYWCQENKDCPIRITFVVTLDENFEVEWVLQEDNQ